MGKARFTAVQIADFFSQAKNGVPDKALCEKYQFSSTTLRRWKERHDQGIRNALREMGYNAAMVLFALVIASVIVAGIFSKVTAALPVFLILCHCVVYILFLGRNLLAL